MFLENPSGAFLNRHHLFMVINCSCKSSREERKMRILCPAPEIRFEFDIRIKYE
ncbi:MAG: hypothetical protein BROFUL_02235 [Candidatus Brocadia fulgida]|jgi:hypothetical protein|uniref:Uncharacterized protein n=1 Tax=Candidatus Brocadia fulgida TaxID=380242 RepID=A0A0M2UX34_9BACT|nr:MAG: hypothetical protein BROFUL_02235 [Candidatus Brocadia fulgida]MBV6518078.1 hypothetical protein [Candidatus Brocadia fulgida]